VVLNVPMEEIMSRKWTNDNVVLLKKIYKEKTNGDLEIIFNKKESAILTKMCRLGLCRNEDYNRAWTETEEQYLRDNYFRGDLIKISEALNRTKKAITERAKLLKIKRDLELTRINGHTYFINENFFKTWTDDMVYILGLIWTDGNMGKYDYNFSICQHKKDKYILKNIYKVFCSSQQPYKNENTFNLSICNKVMYNDLKQLGLEPNKSKTIKMPVGLPEQYISSFIRGALDGDGSVDAKRKRLKISTASPKFSEDISYMLDKLGIENTLYNESYVFKSGERIKLADQTEYDTQTDFFNIRVMKKEYLLKLYHLMYDNSTLYLERKKQAFVKMGVEEPDFLVKNKHIMRKIEGANDAGKKIQFEQVKRAKQNGFPAIDHALATGNLYKGYTWRYI